MKKTVLLLLLLFYTNLSAQPPYTVVDKEQRLINEDIYYKLNKLNKLSDKLSVKSVMIEGRTELPDIWASDVHSVS